MNLLWSTEEIVSVTNARPVGEMPQGVSGISIDTRTLQPGDAFFAIKGDRFDGHDFATYAMKAGASLAVVSEDKLVALGGFRLPLLVVRDVLQAMEKLAVAARERSHAQIIGVTGSAGKTTTKEMLRAVLAPSGKVHASDASFNNHWGVPLSLARMPMDARFGVFEIGMNHPGEIRKLVKLVRPDVALITLVAAAHIGSFKNVVEIAHAKAEIFEGVVKGGHVVINRDSSHFKLLGELAAAAGVKHIHSFGSKRGSEFLLLACETVENGSQCSVRLGEQDVEFRVGAPGQHMALNAVAALGVAKLAGADADVGAAALSRVKAEKGRGESHEVPFGKGTLTVIDESYNANPASMDAALKVLGSIEPGRNGRRIAILGDMLELGESSEKLHKALKKPITEYNVDLVFLGGGEIKPLADQLEGKKFAGHFTDAEKLAKALARQLRAGDVVMVKASNGLRFSSIVTTLVSGKQAGKAAVR